MEMSKGNATLKFEELYARIDRMLKPIVLEQSVMGNSLEFSPDGWRGTITHSEVRSFLERYFTTRNSLKICDFMRNLDFEYEGITEEVKGVLKRKLTRNDNENLVSLAKLEEFTRGKGLGKCIKEELEGKCTEVDLIKEELCERARELDHREHELIKGREKLRNFLNEYSEKLYQDAMQRARSELNRLFRKVLTMENAISDRAKALKSRTHSLDQGPSKKATKQYEARILSLKSANEYLKNRVKVLESDIETDRNTIYSLTERSSKARPKQFRKVTETEQKDIIVQTTSSTPTTESMLLLSSLNTILKDLKLTLPIYITLEQTDLSIGEILFPSFNLIVPQLVEILPLALKHCDTDLQANLTEALWEILIYAWDAPEGRSIVPTMLRFNPSSCRWLKQLKTTHHPSAHSPLYSLFETHNVQKALIVYLTRAGKRTENLQLKLFANFIVLLLSSSTHRILQIFEIFLKNPVFHSKILSVPGSLIVLVSFLRFPEKVSVPASELVLTLLLQDKNLAHFKRQFTFQAPLSRLIETITMIFTLKQNSEIEKNMVIFLQRVSQEAHFSHALKRERVREVLLLRQHTLCSEFFTTNINSIIRNLA